MKLYVAVTAFPDPSAGDPWINLDLCVEGPAGEFNSAYYLTEDKALELQRKLARALDQLAAAKANRLNPV